MPLALVSPFWIRFAGVAAVLGAVFAGGYKVASSHYGGIIAETRAEHLEAVAEANRQSALVNEANRKAAAAIAEADALRNQEQEIVYRTVTREVVKYVETDNARECGLSATGVLLHNTAARGRLPGDTDTSAVTDDGAIEATNAEVMLVVTDNYRTCNRTRDKLLALQGWLRSIGEKE
jgi:hypothetical protein